MDCCLLLIHILRLSILMIKIRPCFLVMQPQLHCTNGSEGGNLKSENNILYMNGRAVYNFSAVEVPLQVKDLLNSSDLSTNDIDMFFMHQGSKFILDTLEKRLNIPGKVPTNLENQGNTISSSIPLLLEKYIHTKEFDKIVISGFGVGLSWASAILQYVK